MSKQIRVLCIISEYTNENGVNGYRWQIVHPDYLKLNLNEYDASFTHATYLDCLRSLHYTIYYGFPHSPEFIYSGGSLPVVDKFEICFQIETDEETK